MKLKPQTRFLQSEIKVDAESRTITFPFSSEAPVQRWYGSEILVHDETSMDASRLNNSAPLLYNHNLDDVIGVVERAWTNAQDRRGYATVRFAKTARADEVLGMVQDRILPNVSFMYQINDAIEDPKKNEMRVRSFTPLEVSIVTVPADNSVGIGRAWADQETEVRVERIEATPAQQDRATSTANTAKGASVMSDVQTTAAAPAVVTEQQFQAQSPIAYEQSRKQAIINLVRANNLDERIGNAWISQGASMEQVSADILAILQERSKSNPTASAAAIGMENKEVRRYSLMKAIRASATGDWSQATLEHEASKEVAKRTGRDGRTANSFFMPYEVQQRDALVSGTGQYLVATQNQSFIEILRNRMVAYQMGAMRMSGLVGNVTIPKQTVGATAYWLSTETTAITEGNQTFAQLALTPRTVGAYTQISRLLQLQSSPDAEALILTDLARQVAIAADLAVLYGTGTEQPTGITQTASIGTLASGTSFDYADILEFQTDVAANNALNASFGYVTTPAIAALCLARTTFTGSAKALWEGSVLDGMMGGFKAMASNQMTSATMLAGSWDTCVIGEWGVLELAVNPNDNFAQGLTGLRAMFTMDVGVKYAGAWSYGTSLT
ncbi:MAG: phage major capsid protein [Betaproteobacteria bacterium]|nr:phage major capsid protein [Betaproteobacteria bacterium]